MNKVNAGITRAYLAYKNVLSKKVGGSTVEYVTVLAGAVMLAGFLYTALSGEENTIKNKVKDIIGKVGS